MRNRTVVVMTLAGASEELAVTATLAVGRSEELLLLTLDAEHLRMPLELVVPDAAAFMRELAARTHAPVAVLLRTRDAYAMPDAARGTLAVTPMDEYTRLDLAVGEVAPFTVVVGDVADLMAQIEAVMPPDALDVDEAIRRLRARGDIT